MSDIKSLQQVMLYVSDQDESVSFWKEKLGFIVRAEEELPENFWAIEVAPGTDSETSIVIFDRAFIKKYSPEVSLETPSLMFRSEDIDGLYNKFKKNGITVGEKVEMSGDIVFNFSDDEGNYFAVSGN